MEHTNLMLDKQGYTHTRACTRPHSRAHLCTRARTDTQICNIYYFSTATMIRERTSVLSYAHIVCFVLLQ